MDRIAELLKHITKEQEGIEIGPYYNPLVPRKKGFNSISLDVFSAGELREQLSAGIANNSGIDPSRLDEIEEVDLIGPAQEIEQIVQARFGNKKFDYVLSSHNLEHIPDPIRFLQGFNAQIIAELH